MFDRISSSSVGAAILLVVAAGCSGEAANAGSPEGGAARLGEAAEPASVTVEAPVSMRVEVLAEYPHDAGAYTQGLVWHDGALYESTGQYGESTLRRVRYEDGVVERSVRLPDDQFGEGIAIVDGRIIQLTWHAGIAHVRALDTFEPVERWSYEGEGWGLAYDGSSLFMSDGTHVLTRRDPSSFEVMERIRVRRGSNPLDNLNELEWVDGKIWANVYETDEIVAIDPQNGRVVAEVDASGLLDARERSRANVLNGIAFRPDTGTFLITGKDWPSLFEVQFVKMENDEREK